MKINESIKNIFEKIGAKLILGAFFVSAVMVLVISGEVNRQAKLHVNMTFQLAQNHLIAAALALSELVSAEELDRYHTSEDIETQSYQELKEQLIHFAEEYNVLYAYFWRDYGNDQGQFIIDNDLDPEYQVGPEDLFEIEEIALDGLAGNIGVTDLGSYTPSWDGLVSGYAPVTDKDGNFYCVAGVDISDKFIFNHQRDARNMMILQIIALSVSVVFGILNMMLYRKKTKQIEVAHNKLQYFNNDLRRAFSTYLSEDVVEEIVSDPTRLQLGGIKRHMTVLFSDVKSFTGIAEA
jgi:hypothetical protein